jgi:hypothetical protein
MKSAITERFRRAFASQPKPVQRRVRKAYALWRVNPSHPSLHFKKVGGVWSARVDDQHRVLGDMRGDAIYWFWIGSHAEYEDLIQQHRSS